MYDIGHDEEQCFVKHLELFKKKETTKPITDDKGKEVVESGE